MQLMVGQKAYSELSRSITGHMPSSRRQLLKAIGSTAGLCPMALLAGCATSTSASPTEAAPASPTETASASPTETACSVPKSSLLPSARFPDDLTNESAQIFAISVEKAYANQRARADGWVVDGTDWTESSVQRIDGRFIVKADVSLDAHKEIQSGTTTRTETLFGSLHYVGWYRITSRRAERAPGEDAETPPGSGWTTVACP